MNIELRNLSFVRHAKSSWDDLSLADIQRPLNHRGIRDAPRMAAKMVELGNVADVIITSPAKRALTTAKYFADAMNVSEDAFFIVDDLYEASVQDVINVVQSVADSVRSVYVFGHNPTMTFLANSFAGVDIDNVPTCGILQAKTMVSSWRDWTPDVSAFVGFYYPKQYAH